MAMTDESFDGTDSSERHIREWIEQLNAAIVVLETLGQKFESRNCPLSMIVPIVEAAKTYLASIRELALARRLNGTIVPSESEV
jgi:hypothetical protein